MNYRDEYRIQKGNYNAMYEWKDVSIKSLNILAKKELKKQREADPKHPYRLVKYRIYEFVEQEVFKC